VSVIRRRRRRQLLVLKVSLLLMAVQIMASAAGWHEFKKGQPTEDERCKCKLTSRNPCGTNICSCRKMTSIVLLLVETVEEMAVRMLKKLYQI
jgi:hypothetical protein